MHAATQESRDSRLWANREGAGTAADLVSANSAIGLLLHAFVCSVFSQSPFLIPASSRRGNRRCRIAPLPRGCRLRRLGYSRPPGYWEDQMRWLRYAADGRESYGIIEGNEVVEVKGDPFAGYERTATRRRLDAVKFRVPVIPRPFTRLGSTMPSTSPRWRRNAARSRTSRPTPISG